jgi:uroporphyrinogen-III synthase
LVVTSGQAVPALPARLHGVPVFCVGDATAAKLRAAGFTRVESAHGDAVALTKLIIARNVPGLHVLAVGERHGQKLAADLRAAGISVLRRRVYKVAKLKNMPDAVRAALAAGEFDGALFYSAETARAFSQLRPPGTGAMQAYALSQNVAKGLQELPWAAIHVGQAPTEADLMALLA